MIEVSFFSVALFIGRARVAVVGLFFFVLVVFCTRCNCWRVVSIWLVVFGSGIVGVCCGVDCGCGGIWVGVIIVVGATGVKDCRGIFGLGSGIRGWNVSARSSVILTFMRRFGVYGNFLRLINSV